MASRKGTLLEKKIERVLNLSGFEPEKNKKYKGYEIDVFFRYKGQKIGIECKQYERSTLTVRNLIHEWDSKNKELGFDKIVLALVGCDISKKSYQLAEGYEIIIWDESKIDSLMDGAIDKKKKNKDRIIRELGIKNQGEDQTTPKPIITKPEKEKRLREPRKERNDIIRHKIELLKNNEDRIDVQIMAEDGSSVVLADYKSYTPSYDGDERFILIIEVGDLPEKKIKELQGLVDKEPVELTKEKIRKQDYGDLKYFQWTLASPEVIKYINKIFTDFYGLKEDFKLKNYQKKSLLEKIFSFK